MNLLLITKIIVNLINKYIFLINIHLILRFISLFIIILFHTYIINYSSFFIIIHTQTINIHNIFIPISSLILPSIFILYFLKKLESNLFSFSNLNLSQYISTLKILPSLQKLLYFSYFIIINCY
jgi:hypothetical protein